MCHRYAGGRMTVTFAQLDYYNSLYGMHFNNHAMGLRFTQSVLAAGVSGPVAETMREIVNRRGERLVYRLTTGLLFGARSS